MTVTAERTEDIDSIKAIMTHDALWPLVSDDGMVKEDYVPNTDDCWLLMKSGNAVIGLYHIHPHNSVTLEIHAQVLPEYRKEHSKQTGEAALKWIINSAPKSYQKVIAQIPAVHMNVIKFTQSFGFQLEGLNRLADRVDGNLCDVVLLGVTRTELEALYD